MNVMVLLADVGETVSSWGTKVDEVFQQAFGDVMSKTPNVLAMIVVLVVGYVLARIVARVATTIGEKIGLQTAAERSGLAGSMKQVGIQRSVPAVVGTISFWLLMCLFLIAAANVLGLPAVSAAMQPVLAWIPKLLVATVIVVVGLLLATFLRGVVATSADRVGISFGEHLANGVYYVLVFMIGFTTLSFLGVPLELFNQLILILAGGLAVGFALAFGLGGRDVMAGILAGYYLRQRIQAGDRVEVAGYEGIVRDVGPVATIIETDEAGLMHRHSIPNTKMLNEAVR